MSSIAKNRGTTVGTFALKDSLLYCQFHFKWDQNSQTEDLKAIDTINP